MELFVPLVRLQLLEEWGLVFLGKISHVRVPFPLTPLGAIEKQVLPMFVVVRALLVGFELFKSLFGCAGTDCITLSITLSACPIIAPKEITEYGFIVINVVKSLRKSRILDRSTIL